MELANQGCIAITSTRIVSIARQAGQRNLDFGSEA
jgi:hypothetical protein